MLPRIGWEYAKAARNYRAKPRELREIQDRKFRELVRHCYDSVPYYHAKMKEAGILPSDLRGAGDVGKLPRLTRETASAEYPGGIISKGGRTAKTFKTTGTTGRPLVIHFSAEYCDMRLAMVVRRDRARGVGLWDRCVTVETGAAPLLGEVEPSFPSGVLGRSLGVAGKVVFGSVYPPLATLRQQKALIWPGNLGQVAMDIARAAPDIVHTRPSYARWLGEAIRESGKELSLKMVCCTAEYLSSSCRSDLARLYKSEVFESYGSSEFGGLAFECMEHAGQHLNSDYFIFESVRGDDAVAPGEGGEILITCLGNKTMPLLRYEQGDVVVIEPEEKCSCGSYLPRLRAIRGRKKDGLVAGDGERVPPNDLVEYLEGGLGLRDFQVVQKRRDRVILRVSGGSLSDQVAKTLGEYLHAALGGPVAVDVEAWDGRGGTSKYRPVVSEAS